MIKIGLIGSSGHYGYALDIIAQDPQLQLVGFAKSHPAERIPTHRAFQEHTQLFASPEELLDQNLDLVIVDSVYGFHGKFCIQAAGSDYPSTAKSPWPQTWRNWRSWKTGHRAWVALRLHAGHPNPSASAGKTADRTGNPREIIWPSDKSPTNLAPPPMVQ